MLASLHNIHVCLLLTDEPGLPVSRTCTAPFDRLKIFLITRPPDLGGTIKPGMTGVKVIGSAVARIYAEGGVLAFWTGNGLSVAKIFPESAIKFFAYESSVSRSSHVHCTLFNVTFGRNAPSLSIGITSKTPERLAASAGFSLVASVGLVVSSVSMHPFTRYGLNPDLASAPQVSIQ